MRTTRRRAGVGWGLGGAIRSGDESARETLTLLHPPANYRFSIRRLHYSAERAFPHTHLFSPKFGRPDLRWTLRDEAADAAALVLLGTRLTDSLRHGTPGQHPSVCVFSTLVVFVF